MASDALDLYERASDWALSKVPRAVDHLDAPTPCEQWDVRALLNHIVDTQRYFRDSARGQEASLPSPTPPELIGDDPVRCFAEIQADMLRVFGEDGVIEKTGPALSVAFSDILVHGWDLAKATGQDATMPDGLPGAAYSMIHGRFTDEQRKGLFAPEVDVGPDPSPEERLLGYTGRDPCR